MLLQYCPLIEKNNAYIRFILVCYLFKGIVEVVAVSAYHSNRTVCTNVASITILNDFRTRSDLTSKSM